MISATMKACQEYSSFAIDPSNRDISDAHVDRLEEAITDVYLLDAYPIVTTAERVIVDGQHRFKMSKSLGIPFYFISGDGVTVEDISLANANTERYTADDALHVYDKLGLQPYQYLAEFRSAHPGFSVGYLAKIMSSNYRLGDFVIGEYSIDRANYATEVARVLLDFSEVAARGKSVLGWKAYRGAVESLVLSSAYDHARMLDRIKEVPTRVVRCATRSEALSLFTDVYNYRKRERIDLTDVDRFRRKIDESFCLENTIERPRRGIVVSSGVHVCEECDLGKFTVHASCRPLRNVDKLIQSIKTKNLLRFYPIVVDRNFIVYDGQRRLDAAKKLGLPIYYIVLQNVSMWMIARAGGLAKSWSLRDYYKHWISVGHPMYLRMAQYMKKYPFLCVESFISLGQSNNSMNRYVFKSGRYQFDEELFADMIRFLSRLPSHLAKILKLQSASCSLYKLNKNQSFLTRLHHVLSQNSEYIELKSVSANDRDAKRYLVDLYNKGLSADNRIQMRFD